MDSVSSCVDFLSKMRRGRANFSRWRILRRKQKDLKTTHVGYT